MLLYLIMTFRGNNEVRGKLYFIEYLKGGIFMRKIFFLNYFCLAFLFISITFLTGCFSTPENTLQEFKKAIDKKDGNKIWSLLSSKGHKIYNEAVEGMALSEVRNGKQCLKVSIDMGDSGYDLPNTGKPLEIESVKVSKNKAVIFVKDNPSAFTLVKEFGSWKVFITQDDIFGILDFFSTPQYTLQEFKKAIDSKGDYWILRLLSSDDKKYYEKILDEKYGEKWTPVLAKKRKEFLLAKMMKNIPELQNTGKELKIKSFTKKSEEKVIAFLEDNPNGITFVKEYGTWKISIWRRTVKEKK